MTTKVTADWKNYYDPQGNDILHKTRILQTAIKQEEREGNHFFRRSVLSYQGGRAKISDPKTGETKEVIMLGSNSYLGLATDERVIEASKKAADKYGYGTGAVSLYAGTTDLHKKLEKQIAEFYRCEDAIIFPTGYAANVGTVSGLARPRDLIVNDMFNHASIYDGCALSGAKTTTYLHNRPSHLRRVLEKERNTEGGTLIITDGVFSMEGDMAKLNEIVEIARKYNATVMIDEAHALGVVGSTGRGTAQQYSLEGKIDITMGTLSKVPGGIGGYVTGSKELCDYLRFYGRSYFFSTSVPAPIIAGLIKVFEILDSEPQLNSSLWKNINYLKTGLDELGFDTGNSQSAIIPVIEREEEKLKPFLRDLFESGIFVNYVAFPAVGKNRARARLSVMAQHTKDDLEIVLDVFRILGRRHGLIE